MQKTIIIKNKKLKIKKDAIICKSYEQQIKDLNTLYFDLDKESIYIKEINKKINSYIQQDKIKRRQSCLDDLEQILEKLVISKLLCSYCKTKMNILYENAYQPNQWTLDRIDNNKGHTIDNCVISCLTCNLSKRQQSDHLFRIGKQLKITKI